MIGPGEGKLCDVEGDLNDQNLLKRHPRHSADPRQHYTFTVWAEVVKPCKSMKNLFQENPHLLHVERVCGLCAKLGQLQWSQVGRSFLWG